MITLALRHVAVWLDELAPERGAFAHALDWSSHLGLPLRGVTSTLQLWGDRMARPLRAGEVPAEKLEACASACVRRGVSWDAAPETGPAADRGGQSPGPVQLSVFSNALPGTLKERLLRQSLDTSGTSVLVCPPSWRPVRRVLILDERRDPGSNFLDVAAELCQAFQVTPVVLTVARTEREARLRQQLAEQRFRARRQLADFDFIAGCDGRGAVACVAQWRRCSHIFVERRDAKPWWRWLRGDRMERLLGLSDSLTFLAIPGTAQPPLSPREARPGLAAEAANRRN